MKINTALVRMFRLASLSGIAHSTPNATTGDSADKKGNISIEVEQVFSAFQTYMACSTERIQRYKEFDDMDEESEVITTALDIYMEDATVTDTFVGRRAWVTSDNDALAQELTDRLAALQVDAKLPRITRNLAKHGDFFLRTPGKLKTKKKKGGVSDLDTSYWPGHVTPIVKKRRLLGYAVSDSQANPEYIAPWGFIHFALAGDANFYKAADNMQSTGMTSRQDMVEYGHSLLSAARRPHKRSKLMHDIVAVTRLTRSPLQRVFKFITDTSNPSVAIRDLAVFRKTMEKIGGINTATESMDYEELMNNITQSIYVPVMKDSKGDFSVDSIGGEVDVTSLVDVELFDNRYFMSLRIPKEQMNFGGDVKGDTLLKDVRYSFRISRLQAAIKQGITELLRVDAAMRGVHLPPDAFKVEMTSPSLSQDLTRLDYFGNAVATTNSLVSMLMTFEAGLAPKTESKREAAGTEDPEANADSNDTTDNGDTKDTQQPKADTAEFIDKGYLVYYILKNIVKLPGFDLKKFYPGAEKYADKLAAKTERTQRLAENYKGYITYAFEKSWSRSLKEAAGEQLNGTLHEGLFVTTKKNGVPLATFDRESTVAVFEQLLADKEQALTEGKKR